MDTPNIQELGRSLRLLLSKSSISSKLFTFDGPGESAFRTLSRKVTQGYGAFVPDLPGCVAVGKSIQQTERLIKKAIEFHLKGMKEDGVKIPMPTFVAEYMEV